MLEDPDLQVALSRSTDAPGEARRALQRLCADRLHTELLDDAQLMLSELVSNALRHGHGQITLRAALDDDRLAVEVIDEGTGFERDLRRCDFEQIGGWGLGLVDDLASRWGVHEGTSHVWFELERPGPRLGEPDRQP
jgi:anti-sigma regulatory factor (Ser/Thr protein kinase)